MIVKFAEIRNNFGKYLKLLDREDIIITRNGKPVARIARHDDREGDGEIREKAGHYGYGGIRMTYGEFMEMYASTDERYEYIDGEAYLLASSTVTHQRVLGNIYAVPY